jgi:hypothetical protein
VCETHASNTYIYVYSLYIFNITHAYKDCICILHDEISLYNYLGNQNIHIYITNYYIGQSAVLIVPHDIDSSYHIIYNNIVILHSIYITYQNMTISISYESMTKKTTHKNTLMVYHNHSTQ